MPDIVIHGGSSFIGKHFIRKLNGQDKSIIILARENSNLKFCENFNSLKIYRYKNSCEELIDKKWELTNPIFYEFSWNGVYGADRNSSEQITINIPLIISSLKFAKEVKAKHWIGIGSQAEYGNLNKKISETDICKPTTLYGKSKLLCSQISDDLCKSYGIEYTWLRLFSVFGPDDNPNWLIPYLISGMLKNNTINTTKAEQCWDYLYIDDVVNVLFKLMDSKGLGVVNLGSGKSIQIKCLIEKIKELTNSSSSINIGSIPYRNDQIMFMEADIRKLAHLLEWKPLIEIEEGLLKTVRNFSDKLS